MRSGRTSLVLERDAHLRTGRDPLGERDEPVDAAEAARRQRLPRSRLRHPRLVDPTLGGGSEPVDAQARRRPAGRRAARAGRPTPRTQSSRLRDRPGSRPPARVRASSMARRRIVARPEDGPEAEEDRGEATRGGQHSEARPRRSPLGRELDRLLLRPDGLRGGSLPRRRARSRAREQMGRRPHRATLSPWPDSSRRRVSSQTVL